MKKKAAQKLTPEGKKRGGKIETTLGMEIGGSKFLP